MESSCTTRADTPKNLEFMCDTIIYDIGFPNTDIYGWMDGIIETIFRTRHANSVGEVQSSDSNNST